MINELNENSKQYLVQHVREFAQKLQQLSGEELLTEHNSLWLQFKEGIQQLDNLY